MRVQAVFSNLFFTIEISKNWFIGKSTCIMTFAKFNIAIMAPGTTPGVLHNPGTWIKTDETDERPRIINLILKMNLLLVYPTIRTPWFASLGLLLQSPLKIPQLFFLVDTQIHIIRPLQYHNSPAKLYERKWHTINLRRHKTLTSFAPKSLFFLCKKGASRATY